MDPGADRDAARQPAGGGQAQVGDAAIAGELVRVALERARTDSYRPGVPRPRTPNWESWAAAVPHIAAWAAQTMVTSQAIRRIIGLRTGTAARTSPPASGVPMPRRSTDRSAPRRTIGLRPSPAAPARSAVSSPRPRTAADSSLECAP